MGEILKEKKLVLHVAAPKSGSTWFDEIIKNLHKFKYSSLIANYARREQEIQNEVFLNNMLDVKDSIYFKHQHVRASEYTINFIEKNNIYIILQVRNIFDTVISMKDHLIKEKFTIPHAYIDENFVKLTNEQQLDMVIDLVIPWFFNFYVSWFEYLKKSKNNNISIIVYDDMKKNIKSEIENILKWLLVEYSDEEIDNAIALSNSNIEKTRKNVGICGRGNSLSDEQRNKILKFAGYYPHVDFHMIGIRHEDKIF